MSLVGSPRVRVLNVVPRRVFPPRRGITVRISALGRELAARHEVRHLTLAGGTPRRRRAIDSIAVAPSQSELRRVHPLGTMAVAASSRFWHGAPILAGIGMRMSNPAVLAPLFRWADVVVVEYPWQFAVCRSLARPGTPCVYSSVNVETDKFRSWAEAVDVSPAVAAPWLRYIQRAERHAIAHADLVTTVSDLDREAFIDRFSADPARTIVVPNGVDSRRFRPVTPEQRTAAKRELGLPDRPVVLFQAADMPANRAGLEWVRRLAAADGRFTFLVVGSVAAPQRSERLVAAGMVPDMRPYLAASDLGLCPIAHGGGTKLKLLECMAAGLPTVAFAEAIRGTVARAGEHVLVVDEDERPLLHALGSLTADPGFAQRLANAARALAEQRYDWTGIAAGLERALVGLSEPTTTPPTAEPAGARAVR
jgi:glycosyltransferase involved in cell wall biosynthesis